MNKITLRTGEPPELVSEEEYVEIYDEVRGFDPEKAKAGARSPYAMTIEEFIELFGDDVSKGSWSKWRRKGLDLNFQMMQILRKAGSVKPLETPVLALVEGHVSPDAAVEMYGDNPLGRKIIIIATDDEPMLVFPGVDETEVVEPELVSPSESDMEEMAAKPDRRKQKRSSIVIEEELWTKLNKFRQEKNLSWADLLLDLYASYQSDS